MVSGSDTESLGSDARGGASEGDSQVEEEEPEPFFPTTSQHRTTSFGCHLWVAEPRWRGFEGNLLKKRSGDEICPEVPPRGVEAALRIALEEVCTGCQV